MAVVAEVQAQGVLDVHSLSAEAGSLVAGALAGIADRTERAVWQQYSCFALMQRDVSFEMCGLMGSVTLLGADFRVSADVESVAPMRRRAILWPLSCVALAVATAIGMAALTGRSDYFSPLNQALIGVWMATLAASVPALGGGLRAWRPGLHFRGLRASEVAASLTWVVLIVSALVGAGLARPTPTDVQEALEDGDVSRARVVLDALVEVEGETPDVLEVEDAVLMAEASALDGEERLAKLELVAAHHGARASVAGELARADRVRTIEALIDAGKDEEALAAIDRDFPVEWHGDPELAELVARVEELIDGRCQDDVCRLVARHLARQARETPDRIAAEEQVRQRIVSALTFEDNESTAEVTIEQVRASLEVSTLAEQVLGAELLATDAVLVAKATTARQWAHDLRASVALLGADRDMLAALLPGLGDSHSGPTVSLSGAELYFVLDERGVCRGIYAVGSKQHRGLDGAEWPAKRILAQALGRPATIAPTKHAEDVSSTWQEGKVKVVARWGLGVPTELRIGDARP